MMVRPVEPSVRKAGLEPAEERLVPRVQPEHDVRLAPVTAEVPFADEHPEQQTGIERTKRALRRFHVNPYGETEYASWCFTVMIPVERVRPRAPGALQSYA